MEREINLILKFTVIFTLTGALLVFLLSSPINSLLFLTGGSIMSLHFLGIKGLSGKITGKKVKGAALYVAFFMLTIGLVIFLTFYLLKRGKIMVIYFLSGTLTLALSANLVMILVLLKGKKDAREDTLDS